MIQNMITYLLFAAETWYVCLELQTDLIFFNNLIIKSRIKNEYNIAELCRQYNPYYSDLKHKFSGFHSGRYSNDKSYGLLQV